MKAQHAAKEAADRGILPIDVMLETMRDAWAKGDRETALQAASMAAPFVHARLQSTQVAMEATNIHWVISDAPLTAEQWCERYGIGGLDNGAATASNGAADDAPGAG